MCFFGRTTPKKETLQIKPVLRRLCGSPPVYFSVYELQQSGAGKFNPPLGRSEMWCCARWEAKWGGYLTIVSRRQRETPFEVTQEVRDAFEGWPGAESSFCSKKSDVNDTNFIAEVTLAQCEIAITFPNTAGATSASRLGARCTRPRRRQYVDTTSARDCHGNQGKWQRHYHQARRWYLQHLSVSIIFTYSIYLCRTLKLYGFNATHVNPINLGSGTSEGL